MHVLLTPEFLYFQFQSNSLLVRSPSVTSEEDNLSNSVAVVTPLSTGTMPMKKSISSSSGSVPPFKPIPPADERPTIISKSNPPKPSIIGIAVPAFSKMPPSISHLSVGSLPSSPSAPKVMAVVSIPKKRVQAQDKISSTNFADRTLPSTNSDFPAPVPQHSSNSIQALLAANNVTEEALELALLQRQQMLSRKPSVSSTTTFRPTSKYANSVGKVMNAPKEYYPVGYDKNFDDNFAARVDLPETSFYCGDQKHFPGLYADEDLGCMVSFHNYKPNYV